MAIMFLLTIVENSFGLHLLDDSRTRLATLFINLAILLSYPVNFFIYCGMSAQFRATQ